jgi:tetratricopeptide (TPR) repeat protein
VPTHGDIIGQISGTFQPVLPTEGSHAPAPNAMAQQLINDGYALEQQEEWAAAIGKYREAQAIQADARIEARITDLQARLDAQKKAQQLIHEGYALEQQDQLIEAIGKYEAAVRLVENPGIRQRIEHLRLRLDQQDRMQALVNEGYALERGNNLPGAIGKYEAAVRLMDNPGIRAKIGELRAEMARQEDQVRRDEAARQERARQEQARLAQQQRAERERIEREQAERKRAERQRAERERRERQQREQAAREQAARKQREREQAQQRQQQAAAVPQVSGTYGTTMREGGETWVYEIQMQQSGNRISGSVRIRVGGETLKNLSVSGTVQGNQIRFSDGTSATVSPDGRSISLRSDDGIMVLRKQ